VFWFGLVITPFAGYFLLGLIIKAYWMPIGIRVFSMASFDASVVMGATFFSGFKGAMFDPASTPHGSFTSEFHRLFWFGLDGLKMGRSIAVNINCNVPGRLGCTSAQAAARA
jgi:hypothetical protein